MVGDTVDNHRFCPLLLITSYSIFETSPKEIEKSYRTPKGDITLTLWNKYQLFPLTPAFPTGDTKIIDSRRQALA